VNSAEFLSIGSEGLHQTNEITHLNGLGED
jgi:hypothetical protein